MIPFLTVGIPAYENESGLLRALDSVAQQTLKDLEILISDDHSKNRLEPYVDKWRSEHPDIVVRYHYQDFNLHITNNKKWIIENGLGTLIAFLEHDDVLIDPEFYSEAQKIYLANSDIKAIMGNAIIDSPLKDELLFKRKIPKSNLVLGYSVYPPRKLMRKMLLPHHAGPLTVSWSSLIFEQQAALAVDAFGKSYLSDTLDGERIEAFPHEEHMIFLALIHDRHSVAYSKYPKSFRTLGDSSFSRNFSKRTNEKKFKNKVDFFNYFRASRLPLHRNTKLRLERNAIYAGLTKSSSEIITYLKMKPAKYYVLVLALVAGKVLHPFFNPLLKHIHRLSRFIYLARHHPKYLTSQLIKKFQATRSFVI
jgi:glycosyltransferase involved in cell wall biosynthesis